jgi:NAD(P)-dependent dehydrogenase (short-subunit alcohol dehydrogenase family)
MDLKIKDKDAMITGGGIGLVIASRLITEGAKTMFTDITGKAINVDGSTIMR